MDKCFIVLIRGDTSEIKFLGLTSLKIDAARLLRAIYSVQSPRKCFCLSLCFVNISIEWIETFADLFYST